MKRLLAIVALALLAGCGDHPQVVDQCLRREIFQACLVSMQSRQTSTVTNGPSDIVSECASAATYQSYRIRRLVQESCRAN